LHLELPVNTKVFRTPCPVDSCPAHGEIPLTIMNGQEKKLVYMPHIDGLRAISFLAILAYHLKPDLLPGGFLGVDVFFIISGFLITNLLLREYEQNNQINFRNFYYRRFARLFPTFVLIILITLIVSFLVFDLEAVSSIAVTALASLAGVANLYFFKTADYFDLEAIEKPLLHIWSLNVEEQFYFVWPILLLIILSRVTFKRTFIISSAIILFLLSTFVNLVYPIAVFYLPIFRAYEFLIGSALAFFSLNKENYSGKKYICILSIAFLISNFFILDSKSYLPGIGTLILGIATLGLISSGDLDSRYNILRWRLTAYVGKRSYTLYLIHWPFIVIYMEYMSISALTKFDSLIVVISVFVISHLVYRFYEQPVRLRLIDSKRFKLMLLGLIIFSIGIASMALLANKLPSGLNNEIIFTKSEIEAGKQLRFKTRVQICEEKGWEDCDDPVSGKSNLLVIGDSHAVDALNALHAKFPEYNYSMSQLGGCPPTNRMRELVPRTFPDLEKCVLLNLQRYDLNYLSRYQVIAINVLYGWYSPNELGNYLNFLHGAGVEKVIVFGEYLEMMKDLPLLINSGGFNESQLKNSVLNLKDSQESIKKLSNENNFFYVDKFVNFKKIAPRMFFSGGAPYTWDTHHLSYEFSVSMISKDLAELEQYLRRQENVKND
jgi:peptidoglycan/LPS O-acetylase OafA/YrhL